MDVGEAFSRPDCSLSKLEVEDEEDEDEEVEDEEDETDSGADDDDAEDEVMTALNVSMISPKFPTSTLQI